MKIFLVRHAEADHLLENWNRKVSYNQFLEILYRWESVALTNNGRAYAKIISENLLGEFDMIYASPLPRTKETALILNQQNREIFYDDELKEIMTFPPKFLKNKSFTINFWINICILNSVFNGNLFKIIKEAKDLYNTFLTSGSNRLLVVSHSARIHSLIFYANLNSYLKVIKKDYKPCGISEVEFCLNSSPDKAKSKILNANE